jgi:hypothetical protein
MQEVTHTPIKYGIFNRFKRYLYGSLPKDEPTEPDMNSKCSNCKVMALFIKEAENRHKIEAKHPQVPIQLPEQQGTNRPRYLNKV